MLFRALSAVAYLGAIAHGSAIASHNGIGRGSPVTTSYLATFEDIPANTLPVLSTAQPPSPYQGLDWAGAVVVENQPAGQYVTALQTDQGTQFIGVNTGSNIVFSVPDAGETFCLRSAYVGVYVSADNSAAVPAQDGVLAFTGTRPDGSTVIETVSYTAAGEGVVKVGGVVVAGRALLQKAEFSQLNGVTAVEVSVQSGAAIGAGALGLLAGLGLDVSTLVNAMALDSLEYDVTTPK